MCLYVCVFVDVILLGTYLSYTAETIVCVRYNFVMLENTVHLNLFHLIFARTHRRLTSHWDNTLATVSQFSKSSIHLSRNYLSLTGSHMVLDKPWAKLPLFEQEEAITRSVFFSLSHTKTHTQTHSHAHSHTDKQFIPASLPIHNITLLSTPVSMET